MQVIAPDLGIRNRPETKLLIHPTGADQSQAITDASFGGPKTITVAGNAKIVSQDLRHPYARSVIYFPGGSSYLSTPDSPDWALGASSFVMEGWFYFLSSATSRFLAAQVYTSDVYWCFDTNGTGQFRFYCTNVSEIINFSSSFTAAVNTFYFVALSKTENTWRFYVNGNLTSTITSSASIPDFSSALELGTYDHSSYSFNGYMSDFRLSSGTDRGYTGATIPVPTTYLASDSYTKLLIRSDNVTQPTTFKDLSPSAKTITATGSVKTVPLPPGGRAIYFDSSGDYISAPVSSDFNFGDGDFTIHFWANPSSLDTSHGVFSMFSDANNDFQVSIRNGPPFWLRVYTWASGSGVINVNTPASSVLADVYSHIAIIRYGAGQNNLAISINGKFQALTWGVNMPAGYTMPNYSNIVIGADTANSDYMAGCLKEFTVVKGRALWSHDFTPPSRAA